MRRALPAVLTLCFCRYWTAAEATGAAARDPAEMSAAAIADELRELAAEREQLEQRLARAQAQLAEQHAAGDGDASCAAGAEDAVPRNKTWMRAVSRNYPRLLVADDFFSEEECAHAISAFSPQLERSSITKTNFEKQHGVGQIRNSQTAHDKGKVLERKDPIIRSMLERMHQHVFIPMPYGEAVQVAKYEPGQYYELHKDSDTKVGRYATFIVYLSDTEEGGETVFPGVKRSSLAKSGLQTPSWHEQKQPPMQQYCDSGEVVKVAPKMGRAVLFFNHFPDLQEDHYALHGSCPVTKGVKWIFQRWIRFYTDQTGNVFYDTFFRK